MRIVAWGVALVPVVGLAQPATFSTKSLTPETALRAAQAALARCRTDGYQVSVAVVDRSGLTQVLLRDRFAGPHTVEIATNKAWSAVSFRTNTTEIEKASRPGQAMGGIRQFPRMVAVGGGMMIQGGGSLVGAIGVSGAPGGDNDDACAAAGIKAIADDLEF
ncbi:MAG: heme-binding protein [Pseudomonadota bacterium]|nr:heme-binding protein [Pseudomonadota bacterium]